MQFSQKFLEHERFRWTVLKLGASILLLFTLMITAYCVADFVRESQELHDYYKRSHSHVYDRTKETACYGCKCSDVVDQFICINCQCDNGTHVIPDTPEQTFERCYATMLLKVCPSLAADNSTVAGFVCHRTVYLGLRAILLGQAHLLNICVNLLSVLMLFVYAYFYPYSYYHAYLQEDKSVKLLEQTAAQQTQAQKKYNNIPLKEIKKQK